MSDTRQPTVGARNDRLVEIDALRGFALFGVFGANLPLFAGLFYQAAPPEGSGPFDAGLAFLRLWLVENKFMGLFSMLFGYSFWLFLQGARARSGKGQPTGHPSANAAFFRRIGWLFVFGAIHGWVFWCWDILRFYALWALLLPLCVNRSPRQLFLASWWVSLGVPATVAAGVVLSGSEGSAVASDPVAVEPLVAAFAEALRAFSTGSFAEAWRANWRLDWAITAGWSQLSYQATIFGHFLMGLAAARHFGNTGPAAQPRLLVRVWWWSAPVGVGTTLITTLGCCQGGMATGPIGAFQAAHQAVLGALGNGALTLAWASGFLWLVTQTAFRRWLLRLAPVGRMALSLYLLQSALGLVMFYHWTGGPAWIGQWTETDIALWSVIGFALQVLLATFWLRKHAQGPMEWLWRSLTWWRWQPWRNSTRNLP